MKFSLVLSMSLVGLAHAATDIPAGPFGGTIGTDIMTIEVGRNTKLDASGRFAQATQTIPAIQKSASEHSPACAGGSFYVRLGGEVKLWLAGGGDSECRRICVEPPEGYEIDTARGISGTASHAWSGLFYPQAFFDKKDPSMCIFAKNWSAHQKSEVTVSLAVCPKGSGCFKPEILPPPPPPPAVQQRVREESATRETMRRKLSD